MAGEAAFYELWDHIPYTEFLDADETEYWQQSFQEAFGPGSTKADHDEWMGEYGLDWEDFDWEDFAEWYSEQLAMPQQNKSNKLLGKPDTLAALTLDNVSAASAAPMKPRAKENDNNTIRPFIFWDGEAVKDGGYCLLGASTGEEICEFPELGTEQCLSLILDVGRNNRRAFHVAFAFDYDVNNILADLSWRHLGILRETTRVVWRGFKIQHIQHKSFQVSKDGVTVRIDDCFSYFRSRFDKALVKYHIGTEDERKKVTFGKDAREDFMWADIEMIIDYYHLELKLGVKLMDNIRRVVNKAGFNVGLWHGSAALAAFAMKQHKMGEHKRTFEGEKYNHAVQTAYAGGWFERFKVGVYRGPVYTADINSAYVYAMSLLPSLAAGEWYHIRTPIWSEYSRLRFGLYHIRYNFESDKDWAYLNWRIARGFPAPLFLRGTDNSMRHPARVDGWYWAPEAELVANDSKHAEIVEAWIFDDDGSYPFEWVADMYQERLALQADNDPAEKALKWAMASMYGKTAQRAGWDQKRRLPPGWHQLEWAGWITSKCRSMIYPAALGVAAQGGLVSIDTDGVMSTAPFKTGLETGIGNQLGRWKVEEFTELVYMQTGFYWLRGSDGEWQAPKTRGIPSTRIETPEVAFEALSGNGQISLRRNLFVGYGAALRGRKEEWRQWVNTPHEISVNSGNKGHSAKVCNACKKGLSLTDALHDMMPIPTKPGVTIQTVSQPHKLPWLDSDKIESDAYKLRDLVLGDEV